VGQGVGIITGAQKGFSWAGVAVAAIAAPIANSISDSLFGEANPNTGLRQGGQFGSDPASVSSQFVAQTGAGLITLIGAPAPAIN
jgi:hypothetical protein